MPRVDLVVESPVSRSPRARQLEGMFDVPRAETSRMEWHGDIDLDDRPWNVGLIVGPSGAGKTQIARSLFGADLLEHSFDWQAASVIDDLAPGRAIGDVTAVCQAVGFNTIPSWLRPFAVLSRGEQFRVDLARRLLELPDPIVVDEFTSVVDRQVAQIGSYAVAKYARKHDRRFVAVTCHYDVIDWLQPDWVLEPAAMRVSWRHLQRRPDIDVRISPVAYAAWHTFAPFHYLTRELHRSAVCYVLFVGDRPASFAGVLHRPISAPGATQNIKGVSRAVTLPDFQGLGLAFVLADMLGAAYKAGGLRLRYYPAHPAYIRAFDRSPRWAMIERPKLSQNSRKQSHSKHGHNGKFDTLGGRPNAVFEYAGAAMEDVAAARSLIGA